MKFFYWLNLETIKTIPGVFIEEFLKSKEKQAFQKQVNHLGDASMAVFTAVAYPIQQLVP